MIEKIQVFVLKVIFNIMWLHTEFCLHMAKKYIGVEGKEARFDYWLGKAAKTHKKERYICDRLCA